MATFGSIRNGIIARFEDIVEEPNIKMLSNVAMCVYIPQ